MQPDTNERLMCMELYEKVDAMAARLDELAAAVRLMQKPGEAPPPGWLVYRTEWCDTAGGRIISETGGRYSAWIHTTGYGWWPTFAEAAAAIAKARAREPGRG